MKTVIILDRIPGNLQDTVEKIRALTGAVVNVSIGAVVSTEDERAAKMLNAMYGQSTRTEPLSPLSPKGERAKGRA